MGLIGTQKQKDPWKLLTNDFKERFKDQNANPGSVNVFGNVNIAQIQQYSNDQLTTRIREIEGTLSAETGTGDEKSDG